MRTVIPWTFFRLLRRSADLVGLRSGGGEGEEEVGRFVCRVASVLVTVRLSGWMDRRFPG